MKSELSAYELAYLIFQLNLSGRESARQDVLTYMDRYDEDDLVSIADLRSFIAELGFNDLEWKISDEGVAKVEEWEEMIIRHLGVEDE